MMTRPPRGRIVPGDLEIVDGAPRSARFGERYVDAVGAFAAAERDFVDAGDGPQRWRTQRTWTVCEIGFGLGVAFLATAARWLAAPGGCRRLNYVGCERHPLSRADLARALAAVGASPVAPRARIDALASTLIERWPPPLPGLYRIPLAEDRIVLTLALGDARELVPALELRADAAYLDGFAPERNPDAWEPRLVRAVARRLAPGAQALASRPLPPAAAAALRAPSSATASADPDPPADAVVVGAGIAGAAVARALCRDGHRVTIVEAFGDAPRGASAQPLLAQHPAVTPDDNPMARLSRAAAYVSREALAADARVHGRVQLDSDARTDALAAQFQDDWVRPLDAAEASERAGVALRAGGLWLPTAVAVDPRSLLTRWRTQAGDRLAWRLGTPVATLARDAAGWCARDAAGRAIAAAPVAVVASGSDALRLAGLESATLTRHWGATTIARGATLPALRCIVGGGVYAAPLGEDALLLGPATAAGEGPHPDDASRAWERLCGALLQPPAVLPALALASGAWRVSPPDHLPLIGAVVDEAAARLREAEHRRNDRLPLPLRPGLFVACGYGGRGLLWSLLGAEIIASLLSGAPAPVERDLLDAVSPQRFLRRRLRRSNASDTAPGRVG